MLAFDVGAWAADPVAVARAHLATLTAPHDAVLNAALQAARVAAAERVLDPHLAAQPNGRTHPIRRLTPERWRALAAAARGGRTPAEDDALARLAHAARALRTLPWKKTPKAPLDRAPEDADPTAVDLDVELDADLAE